MPAKSKTPPQIFVDEDGESLLFYMPPGVTRSKEIAALIETHGGTVSKRYTDKTKTLYTAGMSVPSDTVVRSTDWIDESCAAGELLDEEGYIMASAHTKGKHAEEGSKTPSRNAYTPEEDRAILEYVELHTNNNRKAGGDNIYKDMERAKIGGPHSWQSLKNRVKMLKKSGTTSTDEAVDYAAIRAGKRKATDQAGPSRANAEEDLILDSEAEDVAKKPSGKRSQRLPQTQAPDTEVVLDESQPAAESTEDVSTVPEEAIAAANKVIDGLSQLTGRSPAVVAYALHGCSGNVERAHEYLMLGQVDHLWTLGEDELILQDADAQDAALRRFGHDDLVERLQFVCGDTA